MGELHRRGRPNGWSYDTSTATVVADPIAKAQTLCELLPDTITQARDAGLPMIEQHLTRALDIATRIAASRKTETRATA